MTVPSPEATTEAAVRALIDAVESRDLRRIAAAVSPDVRWRNVPHPPAVGRDAVVSLLGGIATWSDRVEWDVVSAAYDGARGWLERVDRFLIDGAWNEVCCNGVFDVDDAGLVREVRDYVDLGEWRARIDPVLARCATRPASEVVRRHLDAVLTGDRSSMTADYAIDAVLERGDVAHRGWSEIAGYFDLMNEQLAGRRMSFGEADASPDGRVRVRWSIAAGSSTEGPSGLDTFAVTGGRIVHQWVEPPDRGA